MSMNGPLRVGIGGPVGAGKTTLTARLAENLRKSHSIGIITNDIYTKEDAEELMRMQILPSDRIRRRRNRRLPAHGNTRRRINQPGGAFRIDRAAP